MITPLSLSLPRLSGCEKSGGSSWTELDEGDPKSNEITVLFLLRLSLSERNQGSNFEFPCEVCLIVRTEQLFCFSGFPFRCMDPEARVENRVMGMCARM